MKNVLGPTNHTVPSGTGRVFDVFQAINCLATIIASLQGRVQQSLRDIPLLLGRLFISLLDVLVDW
jgi:hypothetical protein